jgi:hypothetical protein
MRKDSLKEEAIQQAYLIYAEKGGFQTLDFSHASTDYARGTVMEPERVSNVDGRYAESPAFMAGVARMKEINMEVDTLKEDMKDCRRNGNFQGLQSCMKRMASLMKEKERIDAKMAVEDLGAAQMAVYNSTMDDDDERFSEMTAMEQRIAALEARIIEFAEKGE